MRNSREMFPDDEPEQEKPKVTPRGRALLNLVETEEYMAFKHVAYEYGSGFPAPIPYNFMGLVPYFVSKIVTDTINQLFMLVEKEAADTRKAMEG